MSTHPASSLPAVAVIGAGAVGCYYGAMLARAGVPVTLVGRPAHVEAMRRDGLRLSTATFDECVPVRADTDMAAAAGASLVLVCVKSAQSAETGAELASVLRPDALVVSLQNGVRNADTLRSALAPRTVLNGIVGFNVIAQGQGRFRRATTGRGSSWKLSGGRHWSCGVTNCSK